MPKLRLKVRYVFWIGVIFLFLLVLPTPRSSAERLPARVYTTADGLGSSAVNRLLYDSRGFLWLATRDGLSRFDGYRFTNYRLGDDATVTNSSVWQILERRNGDYLVVGQDDVVYRFNAHTTVSESSVDGSLTLNAERVFKVLPGRLFEDSDGVLWTGGLTGLSHISEANGKFSIDPPLRIAVAGADFTSLKSYVEDRERTFWITGDRGLIRMHKSGQVLAFYESPATTALRSYFNYLYADLSGRIWVMSQAGVFVLKPETVASSGPVTPRRLEPNIKMRLPSNAGEVVQFTEADGFNSKVTSALHETKDGRIWLAGDLGLFVFHGSGFRRFDAANGVGEYLSGIVEDAAGNLWLGSFSGLFKLALNGFTTFTKTDGMARADVAGIYQNRAGEIFVAQGDWFVSRFDGKKFISAQPALDEARGSPPWTSNISFLDSRESWWFLTFNQLVRYDTAIPIENLPRRKPAEIIATGDDFNNGAFYRLFEDSRGDVWISMRSEVPENVGLNRWERATGTIHEFGPAENLPPKMSPSSFSEDTRGNLWIGFYNGGLARFRDGKFTIFGDAEGLPSGFVTSLLTDRTGRLWIGTSETGLSVVEDTSAERPVFTKVAGISSKNVRALTEDNFGRIYAGTVRGIDRVTPGTDQVLHLSTLDGLADDWVTVAFREPNGTLWFGTRNGVSRYVPELEKPAQEPPILIAGLRIAGEKQQVSELGATEVGKLELKSAQNNLQINFFSVGATSLELIRYQVKLEGADTDWSKPTAERTVNYSNLAPGTYRFLVRAINSQGVPSRTPATVVFRIAPPFWKTWWFSLLVVLLAVGLLYFVLNQRFKRVLDLERVRTRIASDLHDDIGASLSRISMLSEVVKQKTGGADPEASGHLTRIASESRGLVDSMSDIVWAINPRRDSIQSVVDRVCSFAADTLGTKNVHWTVSSPPELRHLHLTAEQKRNLYLVFKEAVNNAAKHANCRNASLKIDLERGQLIAEIRDDGTGFSSNGGPDSHSRGGRGLANMRARAEEIGGKLEFASTETAGTKIILTLPLGTYRINGWFRRSGN